MSEFDQVDSRKNQPADGDVNLEQCDGFDASHREAAPPSAQRAVAIPIALAKLIEPKAGRRIPIGHNDATYVRHLMARRLAWFCRAAARLVAIRPGFMRH